MEFYNDYNRPDVFSLAANPEHALHSPDVLLMTSSQNMFMYEHEYDAPSSKQDAFSAGPAENVFEFPNPEEMAELGCSPLVDSCWPEAPLLAGSLDGSLNDSALSFSWDLEDGDDESIYQHGNSEFHTAPTLAELNLEDSESTDNSMSSLKRKHNLGENDDPNVPRVTEVLSVKQERSLSPQSWKHARSMAVEAAGVESVIATASKTNGHKRASVKRTSRARLNRPLASRNDRSQSNNMSSTMSARTPNTSKISQGKTEVSKLDFSQLFFKRRRDLTPSPSKDMTRSELIATTPNPFGNRRFLGRNALLATKKSHHSHQHQQHQKVPSRPRTHNRSLPRRNIPKTRTSRRTPIKKEKSLISVVKRTDISEEKLWNELKQFMYSKEVKKELPCKTVTADLEAKSESSKSSLSHTTSDPGFDSHDEGLGSEHEDHDDSGSEEEEEEEDMEDDASDISDDPGLPSTSSKTTEATTGERLPSGLVPPKKRRFKTRRSEYDDFTPNPRKLLQIGHELNKLNLTISELTPGNDVSMDERNNTRREKNKLASRACRLKKKAQHEANKVKLWGLNEEAKQLQSVLASMRQEIGARIDNPKACWDYSLGAKMDHLIKTSLGHMVAGHTSEFVNSVLEKTAKGVPLASLKLPAIKV